MKRLGQFGVLLVAAILVAQPVLAEVPCAAGAATACSAKCPMIATGGECPMGQSMAPECANDCCTQVVPQAVVQPASPEKLRAYAAPAAVTAPRILISGVAANAALTATPGIFESPPIYLLNRVFRI